MFPSWGLNYHHIYVRTDIFQLLYVTATASPIEPEGGCLQVRLSLVHVTAVAWEGTPFKPQLRSKIIIIIKHIPVGRRFSLLRTACISGFWAAVDGSTGGRRFPTDGGAQ